MTNEEIDNFITDLNESVKVVSRCDFILSIKKDRNSKPKTVKVIRNFKYGKVTLKRCEKSR